MKNVIRKKYILHYVSQKDLLETQVYIKNNLIPTIYTNIYVKGNKDLINVICIKFPVNDRMFVWIYTGEFIVI